MLQAIKKGPDAISGNASPLGDFGAVTSFGFRPAE